MGYKDEEIKWVYDRTGGHCFYCGTNLVLLNYGLVSDAGAWDVNYFMPTLDMGERRRKNWVPACIVCDTVKGECFPWEFDARRFQQEDDDPDKYISAKP